MCVSRARQRENSSQDTEKRGAQLEDTKCEGCDVVGCDHAPQAGVAQGVGHGPLVER